MTTFINRSSSYLFYGCKENLPLAHILSVSLDTKDEVNNVEHIVEVLVRKGLKSLD